MFSDTILAQSSPPAKGGTRAILRLSGPDAWKLAHDVATIKDGTGYQRATFNLAPDLTFHGSLLLFKSPKSFTGEDIAEFHFPNAPPLIRALIDTLLTTAAQQQLRARLAEPGEFSSRAFFNGKIDLTEAEGIAATISATHQTQLRAAAGLREGNLHRDIAHLTERTAHLLALIEAGIDFADEEDIRFIDAETLSRELAALATDLRARLDDALHIDQLGNPPTVVLIGLPNAGKSSLINALTGTDRSIISPIPGTTRDILAATLHTPHGDIRLIDLPGEEPATDELRKKMMAARETALLDADLVLEIVDASLVVQPSGWFVVVAAATSREEASQVFDASPANRLKPELQTKLKLELQIACRALRVYNKIDLLQTPPSEILAVSAKTGQGVDALREILAALLSEREHSGGQRMALNHRHRALLLETHRALQRAAALVDQNATTAHPELIAVELRAALDHLGQITGTISPDEVLGRIFSQFCIGK